MNLVVDIGNSSVKTAVFQNDRLLEKVVFPKENFFKKISDLLHKHPSISHSIVSSVVNDINEEVKFLLVYSEVLVLENSTSLPFLNDYGTPETLGRDRIAVVAAACHQFPGKNVLVVDAGTCVTYDFKNDKEEYKGGAISPGLNMRFRALNTFTSKLPLIENADSTALVGRSTEESIRTGVGMGLVLEVDGFIDSYMAENKDLTVILTGGDAQFLSIRLKNGIFANSNFLLEGLNYILEFNKTQ